MKIHSKMFYLGIWLAIEILSVCPRTLQLEVGDTVEQVLESIANTSNNEKHVFKRSLSGFKCGYRPIEEVSAFSGIGSFRIVGGKNSVEGGNPWQVSIKQRTFHFCGGSIINDEWVISAAHCFASYRKSLINELVVTVGEYKLHTTDSEEQQFGVVDYFIHPQFNVQNPVNYDVALVHLKGKIVFGKRVQPVCLPDETQVFPAGTMCVGSGWGKTVEGGEVSEILQEVDLPLISAQQCDKVLTTLKLASMDETMTCAGFPEGGRDACQGDSGGPLVCKTPTGLWVLMGVTSWGVGCARKWAGDTTGSNLGTPGVYAKVSSFLPYILEKISIGRAYVDEGECSSSGITLSGVQGSIKYPRTIGRNYSENSLCVWNIVVPTGQNILLKITQMDIEEAVTCDHDYLAVYSNKGVLVGKLCGKELPAPLLVDTDQAQIKFISDSSNSGWGFALNYSAVDENSQKASGCGSTAVLVEQSKIDTVNYPLAYPANADCHWLIKAPVNNIIKLQFLDFEVEQSKECMYDSVSIFNDQSQQVLIAKLCGLSVPGPVWSKGNTMSIHFISDKENNFRGFKADFFFLPAGSEILKQWQPVTEAIPKFVPVADCGVMPIEPQWKNKHIVGGEEAVPHSWPWQATLMYQGTPYCAGAVVDSNWIVTAASCFNMSPLRKYWRVITGDHDRNLVEGTEQVREVIKIIFHPSYNLYTEDYDLALVKVSDLIFNDHVRPVCLPPVSSPVEPSSVCVVSGWGVINEGQQDSSSDLQPSGGHSGIKIATRLQQQYIPIQSTTVCKDSYQHPGGITDRMMCAGFPTTGSASCYGDVGVPLVCEEDGRYVLYGLQSWGIGCGTKPGVYTRIRVLIDWIRSVKDYKPGKRATGTSADEPSMSIRTNECPSNEVLAGLQGSFTSPGYPLEYAGYLNCSWVLNLEPSSTVQISIYNLSITQSNECERAFLRIREEIGNQSILLGQYCGVFNHPLVVKSSAGSVVRFQFKTDEPAMEKGFALNYTVNKNIALDQKDAVSEVDFKQNCGDVLLMGPSGSEIRSPRYPENYPKNASCSWRIIAPLNFIIRIDFKTFSTESSSASCTDNLDIYEGAGATKELLAHFFGQDLPPSVKSSGPELTIVFRATCEQTSKGFLLGYSFMEVQPTSGVQKDENLLSASCPVLVLIQELPGELKSPNYPDHYPGNLDCMWTIYSTSGKKILLEIVDFVTEDTRGCNWDHLDIYDGPNAVSKLLASLCGEQSPMKLISSSSFVALKFKTDSSAGARGFRIKYSETEGVGLGTRTENTFNVGGDSYPCGIAKFKPCGLGQQLMQEQSRIINGVVACPNSWPWQVSLQYKGQHYCGGSLIHQNWVLTAGHCDFNRDTDAVVLGAHDLSSKTEQIQVIQVIAKYNHSNYGGFPPANDLALLRLQTPARLGDTVIPICLPDGGVEIDASWSCVSTGWGATDLVNQVFPTKLNQASLPFVGSKSCADYWGDAIKPTHVCAGAAGSTSCRGDSGGPLECQKDSLYLLIGVVSWGNKECVTQAPAVYTKMSAYRQWISKITNGEV